MRRGEVLVAWAALVDFDNDEAGGKGRGAEDVEEEVGDCAGALLLGRVGRLEDQSCLDGEEEAGLTNGYQ